MNHHSLLVFLIIAFFSFCPFFITIFAVCIAKLARCQLDESQVYPCVICGKNVGKGLYHLFMSAWLCFFTLPLGLGLAMLYALYLWI